MKIAVCKVVICGNALWNDIEDDKKSIVAKYEFGSS
jgi:hypothetical protein